jgi:uncharacterized protein with PIN domain
LSENPPRLLVDRTAGRLARWLRILGLDVEYAPTCDTSVLAREARRSGRRVLTRSKALAERLGGDALLLASDDPAAQARQVVGEIGPAECDVFSRCNLCNAKLAEVPRESVEGRVPAYVFENHDRFAACPVCGRYFWQGTHWRHMLGKIEAILGEKPQGETR